MRELKSRTEVALGCVLLFAAYFVTALLGLRLDAVAGFATLVWPPTGIALAILWPFGFPLCPGALAGALCANLVAAAPLPRALRAWWIGDMVGDLVVAPLLFVFLGRQPLRWRRWMRAEVLLLACALAALGLLVFGKVFGGSISLSRHPYVLFPLLAWAALRF